MQTGNQRKEHSGDRDNRFHACGARLSTRAAQRHGVRPGAAASVDVQHRRLRSLPGRLEHHADRAGGVSCDRAPAGIGLRELFGVRARERDALDGQQRIAGVCYRHRLRHTGRAMWHAAKR